MKFWLACLAPWMVMTVAWGGNLDSASVQYVYRSASSEGAVRMGDRCFVTPKVAKSWGWNVAVVGDEIQVATERRLFRVPSLRENNILYLDLNEAARYLGAELIWDGNTAKVLGRVRDVRVENGELKITSTITTLPKTFRLSSPDRYVIDIQGASLDKDQIQGLPSWYRVGQYGNDIVRVVIEHPGAVNTPTKKFDPTRDFSLKLPDSVLQKPGDVVVIPKNNTDSSSKPVDEPFFVAGPKLVTESSDQSQLRFATTEKLDTAPSVRYLSPTQIEVRFRGGTMGSLGDIKLDSKLIKRASTTGDAGSVTILLETVQPMAFHVNHINREVSLLLFVPKNADKRLAGKVIVIDPGHGGRDSGTRHGSTYEKNIVLPISMEVASELKKQGVSVIMTRSDDSYPGLSDRANLANQSEADIFISIHANSNGKANSRSGGMTFYHMDVAVSRLLAECIQAELAEVSNIPDMGALSDRRLYQSGLSVLRNTKMPAILVELGFVNHTHDRAEMQKKDFKDRVAKAIVKGLKVFLGEQQ